MANEYSANVVFTLWIPTSSFLFLDLDAFFRSLVFLALFRNENKHMHNTNHMIKFEPKRNRIRTGKSATIVTFSSVLVCWLKGFPSFSQLMNSFSPFSALSFLLCQMHCTLFFFFSLFTQRTFHFRYFFVSSSTQTQSLLILTQNYFHFQIQVWWANEVKRERETEKKK